LIQQCASATGLRGAAKQRAAPTPTATQPTRHLRADPRSNGIPGLWRRRRRVICPRPFQTMRRTGYGCSAEVVLPVCSTGSTLAGAEISGDGCQRSLDRRRLSHGY
jgi:hypothetical protein